MWSFIALAIPYALTFASPIMITALGGLMSEKSGVVNIGLDGLMIVGSFASAYVTSVLFVTLGDTAVWIGLACGGVAGGIFSLLHAYASIRLKANQIISGVAINMMAVAITTYFARTITGSGTIFVMKGIERGSVSVLSEIDIIAPFVTKAYITSYIVIVLAIIIWLFINKTVFGMRLEACGEHPQAAETVGINVIKMRYFGVLASGVLSGLGGAIVVLTYQGEFSGSVSGLGFLALATLIFGKWDALKILAASLFFGFAKALATMSALNEFLKSLSIPMQFYNMLPYVITLIALAVFSKNAISPRAAGEPYEPGRR